MNPLGILPENEAVEFVARHSNAVLGSLSSDGRRRVCTEVSGAALRMLELAFPATLLANNRATASGECAPCQQSGIGDRLAEIIKQRRPNETQCSACLAEIRRLNEMTPEQVLPQVDQIASGMVNRASSQASSAIDRLASKYFPSIPHAIISQWIQEAVASARGGAQV